MADRRVTGAWLVVGWCCVVVGLLALGPPASAHKRDLVWTYQWLTPAPTEKEVEVWLTYREEGSRWQPWLEYEFAPAERYAVGLYALLEASAGNHLDWRGWKWENRYRFGSFETDRWLHAGYLELEKEEGEPYELEAKWLLARYARNGDGLAFNLIAEKGLAAGEEIEWGYALGWSRPVGPRLRWGLESLGSFDDKAYYLGPTAAYDFSRFARLLVGIGAGLTRDSSDVLVRALWEYEWF